MFATVSKAPAGLGKTRTFGKRVADSEALSEVYVPTARLAEEWRDNILRERPTKRVQIIRGRDTEVKPNVQLCAKHLRARELTNAGLAVYQNLCSRSQGPNAHPIRCQHFSQCKYIDQFLSSADVYIYTHAHLALERGALEDWEPSLVVIDESFYQGLIEEIVMPLSLLTHPGVPPAAQRLCSDVAAALQIDRRLDQRFSNARGPRGELNAAIKALTGSPALLPTLNDAQQRAVLANTINFKPVRFLLSQLDKETMVRAVPRSVKYNAATGDIVLQHRRSITRFDRADGTQPQIIILDASANPLLIEPFFQISQFLPIDLPRNAHVIQCHSTRCSTTSLVPAKNKDPKSIADATRRCADIEALIAKLARNGTKVLVVGPAAVVGNPKTSMPSLIAVPPHCELAHFNALRGVDRWRDFDAVVLIGRNEPPAEVVENMARALFFDDPVAIQITGQWDYQVRGYRIAGSQFGVETAVHADPRVQAILEQLRECESVQAIDRLRLVHAAKTKTVIVLSNLPLDLDVHEIRTWDELINGTRLEQAWDACGGVVLPLNPAWLAANTGGLWPTAAAAKKDVERAPRKGHFPNVIFIRKVSLSGYRYKSPRERRWSQCLSTLTKPAQVAAALEKLIGQAVVVRVKG